MKLLRIDNDKFDFGFSPVETDLLLHMLGLYPLVPESHHRLTMDKQLPKQRENQRLLDESLKVQREANRKEVASWLNDSSRFKKNDADWRVTFGRGDLEWLLQVLNDVRIGSWIASGSPNLYDKKQIPRDKKFLRYLMRMEIAGSFEMFFLGALNGSLTPGAGD